MQAHVEVVVGEIADSAGGKRVEPGRHAVVTVADAAGDGHVVDPGPDVGARAVTVTSSAPLVELIERGENRTDFSTGLDVSTPLTTDTCTAGAAVADPRSRSNARWAGSPPRSSRTTQPAAPGFRASAARAPSRSTPNRADGAARAIRESDFRVRCTLSRMISTRLGCAPVKCVVTRRRRGAVVVFTFDELKDSVLRSPAGLCGRTAGVPVTVNVGLSAGLSDSAFGPWGVPP